jgi:hypothetical protein
MRWIIFEVISFLAVFMVAHGIIVPWAIANDSTMPLWADMVIIIFLLMLWVALIDRCVFYFRKVIRKYDEDAQ